MGTITFAGEGASSAQNTIDTTAAGDIWDNTSAWGYTNAFKCNDALKLYVGLFQSMVDGLAADISYTGSAAGDRSNYWLCFNLHWC